MAADRVKSELSTAALTPWVVCTTVGLFMVRNCVFRRAMAMAMRCLAQ